MHIGIILEVFEKYKSLDIVFLFSKFQVCF